MADVNAMLAPYAVPHTSAGSRREKDTPDDARFPFQRDRDRVIHSDAFRRLKHKTQVFVAVEGDHFRTRLTHTLEVAQISRSIARALSVNEDLTEAIALAHDLGHTPFGHAGEDAMAACMKPYGKTFEHNAQSYRIVTILEERKRGVFGLNLNQEVLEGLLKHSSPHDAPSQGISLTHSPTVEAQIANVADEIAYTGHDCDDGIRAGLFSLQEIDDVIPEDIRQKMATEGSSLQSALIDWLTHDLLASTAQAIERNAIHSLADVLHATTPLVVMSKNARQSMETIRAFLWSHMYLHPRVAAQAVRGKNIIENLFAYFIAHPNAPINALIQRAGGALEEAVKDYIAGMTDTFAMEIMEKLDS